MKSKLKLALDELEKELTIITQSELAQLMGGTGSSYSSGLSAESSIGDVVNYFTAMGFSFTQDSSGNYYMNGYANGSTGSISNGILIEAVSVVGYVTSTGWGEASTGDEYWWSTGFNGYELAYLGLFQSYGYDIPGQGGNSSGYQQQHKQLNTRLFKNVFQGINNAKKNEGEFGGHYVAEWIGGNVYNNWMSDPEYRNSCAFSLSLALNIVGGEHAINQNGNLTNSGDFQRDGTDEWYYFRASDMYNYLKSNYGQGTAINSLNDIPYGAEGFIYFKNFSNANGQGTSDHIDYYDGIQVMGYDYSNRQGVTIYFVRTN